MIPIAYTKFTDKESGLSIRSKINLLGSNVSSMSSELIQELADINSDISDIDDRVTILEVAGLVGISSPTKLPAQAVSSTPSKLIFFTIEDFKCGTSISTDAIKNTVTINNIGKYIIFGSIVLTGGNGDAISVRLYQNSNPTNIVSTVVSQGASKQVTLTYAGHSNLNAGDVLELYIDSTGTSIQVDYSTIVIEEKIC